MVVMFQVEVLWVEMLCSVVVGYQRFRGPCRLHLQGEENGLLKRWFLTTHTATRRHNPEDLYYFSEICVSQVQFFAQIG